ncbi:hypothetical protein [Methanosarcina sp. MTP4]|uniref:hypothetical protein n=1 Tax=Methanosarcina sp. MTP4 TaxID=1434100 RepID=UPI00064E4190|nr:hypothetical protein [Methanosarcina sp. MTP4]
MMYDKEGCSGKIMYEVAQQMGLVEDIKKLCEITWEEGLQKRLHGPNSWTYAGMLGYLGKEMIGKNAGKAGPLMYKNAQSMDLIERIKDLHKNAWEIGLKRGCHQQYNWTLNGMLEYFGRKIAIEEGKKIPSKK